jgi:hypothetical protein
MRHVSSCSVLTMSFYWEVTHILILILVIIIIIIILLIRVFSQLFGFGRFLRSSSPGRVKNFHFSISSRPALGPTQPPTQCVPGAPCKGESGRGLKVTIHLQLVSRRRKCGSINPHPIRPHGVVIN